MGSESGRGAVVALGCFDGVHAGHRALLLAAKAAAAERGLSFTVWSLTGKPGKGGAASRLLCSEAARERLLREEIGADRVILAPFCAVHALAPEKFVREILQAQLHAAFAVCGENFRFGKGGAGDASVLRALMQAQGGDAFVLPLLRESALRSVEPMPGSPIPVDPVVSSTRIRALLEAGDPAAAALLLGRPFFIEGEVCRGKALGRTLGFPTANLRFPDALVRPKRGVYFGRVTLQDGARYAAVCNLGMRPTVEDGYGLLLECCLLDFSGSLYGQQIRAELLHFLRPERRFASREELQAQVLADLETGKELAAKMTHHHF